MSLLGQEQQQRRGGGGKQQSWRAAGGGRRGRTHWPLPRAGVPIVPALASLIKARPGEKDHRLICVISQYVLLISQYVLLISSTSSLKLRFECCLK